MEFPKKQIDDLQNNLRDYFADQRNGTAGGMVEVDPKDLEDLILYAELANARNKELENDCAGLMFKLRCVAQALK